MRTLWMALVLPLALQEKRDPAAVEKLLKELEGTAGRYWNVPREDAKFLGMLVGMTGAQRVLEVGTANGYSAIWMGLALEKTGGRLTTIEINPEKAKEARENLRTARLDGRVTVMEGDAHKIVRQLDGPWDLIFIDADMGRDLDYFEALFPKLAPGGVLARHNAIKYAAQMKDYLDQVKAHPQLDTVILSCTMDDGFALSRKRKE
jgi:predicted O-methyltransferase YrrM